MEGNAEFVWRDGEVLRRNLTVRLFEGRDDGSSFLMLPRWNASSPAYAVTDTYVVSRATHADSLAMPGLTNPI